MMAKDIITAEKLRELLHYDPETGVFTWLGSGSGRPASGIAGTIANGYLHIWADGRSYKAHRLAWLYQTGEWPEGDLDHANMDKADNRWCNLREATDSKNQANTRARVITGTSRFKGVTWNKEMKRFRALITVKGKQYFLGYFDAEHLAYAAYCLAARKHFGEFARVYDAYMLIIPKKKFEERVLRNLLIATQPNYARAA
jgi:HNH endonuclease/AP2 domain